MKEYKKHKLNIFPEPSKHDYTILENNILMEGYDTKYPILIYENDILDGWSRYQICKKHKVIPVFETFEGNEIEAIKQMLRTNTRRNITSSQWAAIANEATDLINELQRQAKERMLAGKKIEPKDKIVPPSKGRTTEKLAEIFPTSKTQINDAKRIKRESPQEFEKIKSGEKSISQIKREQTSIKKDDSDPFFYETSKLLGRAFDHLERILQKEFVPKTKKDFIHINSINNELYRLVTLAGKAGIDIKEVWEKLAGRHGEIIEMPKHLKRPSEFED